MAQTMPSHGDQSRFSYAGGRRGINWPAAGAALGLQALFLAMLLSLGIVGHKEKRERLITLSVEERSDKPAAPSQPAPPRPEVRPMVQPQPKTDLIVPLPKVDIQPKPSPVETAIEAPADPSPPVVAAPAAAPAAPAGSSGPVKVANLASNLLNGAPPAYPKSSRTKREEGIVVIRVVVSAEGRVAELSISQSSGFQALDDAALAAVRNWRWSPTVRDGRAVSITGLVRIPFTLRNS